jgi:hypothetical protein
VVTHWRPQYGGTIDGPDRGQLQGFSRQRILGVFPLEKWMKWQDTFIPVPGRIKYTWDTKHTFTGVPFVSPAGDRRLKCINCGYAPLELASMCFLVTSRIIPGYNISDHLPILLECKIG